MKFYKTFEKYRPEEIKKPEAPFYLAIKSPDEQIWYMRSPLGKNQLGKFLSDAVSAAEDFRTLLKMSEDVPTTFEHLRFERIVDI